MRLACLVLVPFVIVPLFFAALMAVAITGLFPANSVLPVASIVAIALAALGVMDRSKLAPVGAPIEQAKKFAGLLLSRYSVAAAWAIGGLIISRSMGIDPAWPAAVAIVYGIYHARKLIAATEEDDWQRAPEFERGSKLKTIVEPGRPKDSLEATRASSSPRKSLVPHIEDEGLEWGGEIVPYRNATEHFFVAGTSGSGKTVTIRLLMQQVLPRIGSARKTRAFIYDYKGEAVRILGGMSTLKSKYFLMDPFDERGVAWNLAADITDRTSAFEFSKILIPDPPSGGSRDNQIFYNTARHLVTHVILALRRRAGNTWTLRDLIEACRDEHIKNVLGSHPPIWERVKRYFETPQTQSFMVVISQGLAAFDTVAMAWSQAKQSYSLSEWVQSESILILGSSPHVSEAAQSINQAIVERLTQLVLSKNGTPHPETWFFLDEFRFAGRFAGLSKLLTAGRSMGVCVVVGFQDISGLQVAYGVLDANEVVGQCSHGAILRLNEPNTQEWASRMLGDREQWENEVTKNKSSGQKTCQITKKLIAKRLILPIEFRDLMPHDLERGRSGYFLLPGNCVVKYVAPEEVAFDTLIPRNDSIPGRIDRLITDDFPHWTDVDLKRLGIGGATSAGNEQTDVPDPKGVSLKDIERMKRNPPKDSTD